MVYHGHVGAIHDIFSVLFKFFSRKRVRYPARGNVCYIWRGIGTGALRFTCICHFPFALFGLPSFDPASNSSKSDTWVDILSAPILSVCMGSTWFNPTPGMSCLRECVYFSFSPAPKT